MDIILIGNGTATATIKRYCEVVTIAIKQSKGGRHYCHGQDIVFFIMGAPTREEEEEEEEEEEKKRGTKIKKSRH